MNNFLLNQVISVLSAASPEKPWMTAKYLASKIGGQVDGKHIEQALLDHCRDTEDAGGTPLVRYSNLPSRRTLEVLWGAIQNVGSRSLENITQDKVADESLARIESLDRADVFLSHSHRDYAAVMAVAKHLLDSDVVPWLAETHIERGQYIHDEIIGALGTCEDFVLYLSPNALVSRWTEKEFHFAAERGIPIFVVADIDFDEITELLHVAETGEPIPAGLEQQFRRVDPDFLRFLVEDRENIIEVFAYSRELRNKTLPGIARPYTELPNSIKDRRSRGI